MDCTFKTKMIGNFLNVASLTQRNVTMPAGPSETKVFEQDRVQI